MEADRGLANRITGNRIGSGHGYTDTELADAIRAHVAQAVAQRDAEIERLKALLVHGENNFSDLLWDSLEDANRGFASVLRLESNILNLEKEVVDRVNEKNMALDRLSESISLHNSETLRLGDDLTAALSERDALAALCVKMREALERVLAPFDSMGNFGGSEYGHKAEVVREARRLLTPGGGGKEL